MIVSIAQPAYLPWLGYFHRVALSDLHIGLNTVPVGHRSFTNRNKVRTANGPTWLTVPMSKGGSDRIDELRIADDPRWRRKHWDTIRFSYAAAPHFSEHAPYWEEVFGRDWSLLEDLIDETTGWLLDTLGIGARMVKSADVDAEGTKSDLILNLCRAVDADVYLSGPLGRDYLDAAGFESAGIELRYHDYVHPVYEQAFDGFEPYMSAIDALFNHGPGTLELIGSGNPALEELATR